MYLLFLHPFWKASSCFYVNNWTQSVWPLLAGFQAVSDLMLGCGFFFFDSFGPLNSPAPTSFVAVSGAKRSDAKAGVAVCAAHAVEKPQLDFSLGCNLFRSSLINDSFHAQFVWHWYVLLKMLIIFVIIPLIILIRKLSDFDQQVLGYKYILFALPVNSDDIIRQHVNN